MDSFHNPNFPLVSEVLLWLALRFEPDTNLPQEIKTSEQRVYFIRSIVEFFVSHYSNTFITYSYNQKKNYYFNSYFFFQALKTNIKLNVKKLYQADRNAVDELLKITYLLNNELNSKKTYEDEGFSNLDTNLTYKVHYV